MVHFSKLKLYGFKSFIDKTELDIGPGLNGIVGPNGCGKSNLVEALRWVMGEKSAKNMRGGGMEDVIFAGTSKRPARNMAQSTVVLDNQDMNAPEPFNTTTEIEITRTIERDKGSQYRVNGKAVRARDVYLLFADTMTGANSPALVSQGRITEIIVAKPQDRRRILEESAGISGLHSRRHEAELRLNAAEKNLERLNDLIKDRKSRLSSLKRQARQAELYKELSAEIRRADMAIAWSEWTAKHQSICLERKNFEIHNQSVQQTLIEVKKQTVCLEDIEKRLPELRKNDMESRAVLQNFKISFERLEQDSKIKQNSLDQAIKNRNQMNQDIDFVKNQLYDVCERIDFITNDIKAHKILVETLPSDVEDAVLNRDKTQTELNHIRDAHSALMQDIAVTRESRQSLGREYDSSQSRLKHIEQKIKMTNDLIAQNDMDISSVEVEKNEITDLNKIKNLILIKRKELEKSETLKYTLIEKETLILSKKDSIHLTLQTLQAEKEALESLLTGYNNNSKIESEKSLLNVLNVQSGYEKIVTSAFGQFLSLAGTDSNSLVYWTNTTNKANLVQKNSLSNYVDAPQSLEKFLNSVLVCDALPNELPNLDIGQILVANNGSMMRWDGMVVQTAALDQDTTHIILEQRNRLEELKPLINKARKKLDDITKNQDDLNSDISRIDETITLTSHSISELNTEFKDVEHQSQRLNDKLEMLKQALIHNRENIASLTHEFSILQKENTELKTQYEQSDTNVLKQKEDELSQLQSRIEILQEQLDLDQNRLSKLRYDQNNANDRIQTLLNELKQSEINKKTSEDRLETLLQRLDQIEIDIKLYKESTDSINEESKRESLLSKISTQQNVVDQTVQSLEKFEVSYKLTHETLRKIESDAANARELRAASQANITNAEMDRKRIADSITDQFKLTPQSLEEQTLSLFDNVLPTIDALQTLKTQSSQRRNAIGPVNLRAAIESQESEKHLSDMEEEHNDLTKAITQLRSGITRLNTEARDRLALAFKRVDMHFKSLFQTLFNGGHAYLEMIESDDPLESGLEIYAQPPGKSLQKLSLLSGGEQTLTAIALIFSMFLTNPSPICVLDEIDAPLDDANVDRVCTLMEKIVHDTQTRFLVITHHRMTMARMNRLYGVTMSERGISQLVSVDMALQDELSLESQA